MLGISLAALEITVVGTATPNIVRDIGGFESYSWIFTMYLVSSTIFMPFWGRASDHWGRKPVFITAMIIFLLGTILCGLSTSFNQLIIFRGIQGLGGGGLIPLAFTIVADVYDLKARTKIQGYLSSVWGVCSLIGPFIGGAMADTIGWRWIFFINVIPGSLALFFILKYFHEKNDLSEKLKLSIKSLLISMIFVLALLATLYFFQIQQSTLGYSFLAISVITLLLFINSEKLATNPLIPPTLFKHPVFTMTCITGFLSSAIIVGLASFIPLLFQAVLHYSATMSGLVLFPFTISWVIFSIFSTRLLLYIHYKKLLFLGFCLVFLGMGLFNFYFFNLNAGLTIISMIIMGAGMSFNYPIVLITTQYDVPKDMVGFATSAIFWIRNLGSTIGITIMGITLSWQFQHKLLAVLPTEQTRDLIQELNANPDILLQPEILSQIKAFPEIHHVLYTVMHWVFLILLAYAFANLLTIFGYPKKVNNQIPVP